MRIFQLMENENTQFKYSIKEEQSTIHMQCINKERAVDAYHPFLCVCVCLCRMEVAGEMWIFSVPKIDQKKRNDKISINCLFG